MKIIATAVAAACLIPSAVCAQALSLHPDETVTLRFNNQKVVVERIDPAKPMDKFEIYAVWRAQNELVPPGAKTVPPQFIANGEGPPNPPQPSGNELKVTMRSVPGLQPGSRENTVLMIENGYGSALRYRATMYSGSKSAVTDVCDAAPHRLALEHWPFPIDKLEIADLQLIDFKDGIQCG
jgi:hypothetical protein